MGALRRNPPPSPADRHAVFHFFQLHDFQAEDVKDISQEAQTRPPREPGGKSGAYSAD